jgi:hypothetical protein
LSLAVLSAMRLLLAPRSRMPRRNLLTRQALTVAPEISAPGFRGNTHANIILPWYYTPVWRDFPEFWDYGAQWDQHKCSDGFVFKDKDNCLAIYSLKHDPTRAERLGDRPLRSGTPTPGGGSRLWPRATR